MANIDKSKLLKPSDFKCEKCGAPLRLSRARNGRTFWSCSNYPVTGCNYHTEDKNAKLYMAAKEKEQALKEAAEKIEEEKKDEN